MKENEAGEKEAGELKAFPQKKILLINERLYSAWPRGFYSQPLIQNTKTTKENTITMEQIRKKAKKMTNISQKVNRNMNSVQKGKFAPVREFRTVVRNSLILFFL